jgi:hypothetical protein
MLTWALRDMIHLHHACAVGAAEVIREILDPMR